MQKAHDAAKNDFWHNRPDTSSPITETELNRIETNIDTIDDRVVTFDITKANQSDLLTCVSGISLNTTTGILTITLKNGTTSTLDTGLAKLAINFDYDDDPSSAHYQQIILEMKDGTYKYIDLSALITQYEFVNTSTIVWTIESDGKIKANVPNGSITAEKLQPNYLADVTAQADRATGAVTSTESNRLEAEGFAKGTQNGQPVGVDSPYYENNAKFFRDGARAITGNKVDTWNGRDGMVVPLYGDYDISKIAPGSGAEEGQVPVVDSNGKFTMGHGGNQLYGPSEGNYSEISLLPYRKNIKLYGPISSKIIDDDTMHINFGTMFQGVTDSSNLSNSTVNVSITNNGNFIWGGQDLNGTTIAIYVSNRYISTYDNAIQMRVRFYGQNTYVLSGFLGWAYGSFGYSGSYSVSGCIGHRIPIAPGDVIIVRWTGGAFQIISHIRHPGNYSTGPVCGSNPANNLITSGDDEQSTYGEVLMNLWAKIKWELVSEKTVLKMVSDAVSYTNDGRGRVINTGASGNDFVIFHLVSATRSGWAHNICFSRDGTMSGAYVAGFQQHYVSVSDDPDGVVFHSVYQYAGQSVYIQDLTNQICKGITFEIIY